MLAAVGKHLAVEAQQRLLLVNGVGTAMRDKVYLGLSSGLPRCRRKGFADTLAVVLYLLAALKTAQLSLQQDVIRHSIAGAPSFDMSDQNTRLIVSERAMRVGRLAENLQ